MTKLTNQTILEFKLTEEGKNHVRDMLLSHRKLFESLLFSNGDYPPATTITEEIPKIVNIENLEYKNMIKYIDELFEKTNNETIQMMFLDFLSIFGGGIHEKYIVDGDITILENTENN